MFTFPVSTEDLFNERTAQFIGWGTPERAVRELRSVIDDAWRDGPGGWTYEWARRGAEAERRGEWQIAAAFYGGARFPTVNTPIRQQAYQKQIECYLKASSTFPCAFERLMIEVPYRETHTPVVVHFFAPRGHEHNRELPLICFSGGVDTLKMDLHNVILALVLLGGFAVAAIDMPGTGESQIALAPDAEAIYTGVLDYFRDERGLSGKAGVFGISFGGHWSAKLAFGNQFNASVVVGGPIGEGSDEGHFFAHLPNGMTGIVYNAMGWQRLPTPEEAEAGMNAYSLRHQGLFDHAHITPTLATNGERDPYLVPENTLAFHHYQEATVWLVKDAAHCAVQYFPTLVPAIIGWLRLHLSGQTTENEHFAEQKYQALVPLLVPERSTALR